jgi:PAS domain S-box-containing protein
MGTNLMVETNLITFGEVNNLWQTAVEKSSDQIVITKPDGTIVYANPAAAKTTGYSHEEIVGKAIESGALWSGLMEISFYERMRQTVLGAKIPFWGEVINRRKDGTSYICELSVFPVLGKHGEVKYLLRIERDITRRRELDKSKDDFLSLASHQLRTPLTSISLAIDFLLHGYAGDLNREQRSSLREVYQDVHNMADLISVLLNFSRIQLGTFSLDVEPLDLIEIAGELLSELAPQIRNKQLQVETHYGETLQPALANRSIIKVALQNVLANAVKYTPAEGRLSLSIEKKRKEIVIAVSDSGCGIPAREQRMVFTKFFRGKNVSTKEAGGSGLGLYFTKPLLEACGGRISFTSKENKGTTFYIALPLAA